MAEWPACGDGKAGFRLVGRWRWRWRWRRWQIVRAAQCVRCRAACGAAIAGSLTNERGGSYSVAIRSHVRGHWPSRPACRRSMIKSWQHKGVEALFSERKQGGHPARPCTEAAAPARPARRGGRAARHERAGLAVSPARGFAGRPLRRQRQRQLAIDFQVRRARRRSGRLPGRPLRSPKAMTRIFDPPHPGETLREDVLPALGLTVTEAAAQLGVTRAALFRVLHGHAGISPEMALRIEGWLGEEKRRPRGSLARAAGRLRPVAGAREGHAESDAGAGTHLTAPACRAQ